MIYHLVFGFAGSNQGWQEVHALKSAQTDPTLLLPVLANLGQARANFLGAPYAVNFVGLRKFFDEGTGQRARGVAPLKQTFTAVNPNLVGGAEPGPVAVLGTWQPDTSNPQLAAYAGNSSLTHFGAPPDLAVNNGGDVDQGAAGLGASIASFRQAMIAAGAGWLAVTRADDIKITGIAQNADGTITVTVERAAVPPVTLNATVTVRVRRINNGKTPIPGQLLGFWKTATTFVSNSAIGIPTPQIGGFLRTYSPLPTFLPYKGMIVQGKVGNHKRGRPFGSLPGRRKALVRG